ncbi:hypothetical protein LMG33810_001218 [Carnimonas sp. LMG 33810]
MVRIQVNIQLANDLNFFNLDSEISCFLAGIEKVLREKVPFCAQKTLSSVRRSCYNAAVRVQIIFGISGTCWLPPR